MRSQIRSLVRLAGAPLLLVLLAVACSDAPTSPRTPDAALADASFALQGGSSGAASAPGLDRAAVARAVPGFGGFHYEDGVPTVHLTDARQRPATERALARFLEAEGYAPTDLRVEPGRFKYLELDRWFGDLAPEALGVAGVAVVDLEERRNRVVVGVTDASAGPSVRSLAARLGVPEEALLVERVEPVVPMVSLRDAAASIEGGVQIHFGNYLCTLGFLALSGSDESFVTNSHCTNTQGGVEGTVYYQPLSSTDPAVIGTEVADPGYFRGGVCPRGYRCRYSDSSRALRQSSRSFTRGEIARTTGANNGSLEVVGSFTITGTDDRSSVSTQCTPEGTVLDKVGRTTGWTQGTVTRSCAHTGVSGTNLAQLYQTWVAAGVNSGDSGSPVFRLAGGDDVTLYGILWGGSTSSFVFSPITNVEYELGSLDVLAGGGGTEPPPATSDIALTVTSAQKVRGTSTVALSWSPSSPAVNVYANGTPLATNDGDGSYTHSFKGGGTLTYQVCETANTSACSNAVTVSL